MDRTMTQLDILSETIMGDGARVVNIVGVGCVSPDKVNFEAFYNKDVNFLCNQGGGYRLNYPR